MYSSKSSGVLWAEAILRSYGTPNSSRILHASEAFSKSESLPQIIPTLATEISYLDYNKNSRAFRKKGVMIDN